MTRAMRCASLAATAAILIAARPAAATELVVLATRGDRTEVRVVALSGAAARGAGVVRHAADGVVRGATVDDETVLVAAEEDTGPDRSFSGALWRVDLNGARRLVAGLAYASRPVVVGRKAYVQAGRAGAASAHALREDALEIVEVDVDDGTTRAVLGLRGQLAYPIGVVTVGGRGELITYLVGPPGSPGDGGRLAAVGLRDGAVRDLGRVGVVRDLGLSGADVVFEAREPGGARTVWSIDVTAAGGGRRRALARGGAQPLAPLVSPAGELRLAAHGADGSAIPRAISADGVEALQRYRPGEATPHLVLRARGREVELPATAPGERLEPIGFREAP